MSHRGLILQHPASTAQRSAKHVPQPAACGDGGAAAAGQQQQPKSLTQVDDGNGATCRHGSLSSHKIVSLQVCDDVVPRMHRCVGRVLQKKTNNSR